MGLWLAEQAARIPLCGSNFAGLKRHRAVSGHWLERAQDLSGLRGLDGEPG